MSFHIPSDIAYWGKLALCGGLALLASLAVLHGFARRRLVLGLLGWREARLSDRPILFMLFAAVYLLIASLLWSEFIASI